MAKKLNRLIARIEALETTIAKILLGQKTSRKTAKPKRPAKAKPTKRKAAARRATGKAAAKPAATKKAARKKPSRKKRPRTPTIDQLVPRGAPEFVTPLEMT